MSVPQELKYVASHEWVQLDGDIATIGITDHAQEALGDVVYVDLPDVGDDVERGAECGEVESVKAVSALYAPVSGEVTEVNEALEDAPETVNSAPTGTAGCSGCSSRTPTSWRTGSSTRPGTRRSSRTPTEGHGRAAQSGRGPKWIAPSGRKYRMAMVPPVTVGTCQLPSA